MGAKVGEENCVCSGRNPKTAALSEQKKTKVLGRAGREGKALYNSHCSVAGTVFST